MRKVSPFLVTDYGMASHPISEIVLQYHHLNQTCTVTLEPGHSFQTIVDIRCTVFIICTVFINCIILPWYLFGTMWALFQRNVLLVGALGVSHLAPNQLPCAHPMLYIVLYNLCDNSVYNCMFLIILFYTMKFIIMIIYMSDNTEM